VRTASGRSEPGTRAEADLTVAVLCRRGAAGWAAGSERLPRCPEAGDCWSHFIISPKPKPAPRRRLRGRGQSLRPHTLRVRVGALGGSPHRPGDKPKAVRKFGEQWDGNNFSLHQVTEIVPWGGGVWKGTWVGLDFWDMVETLGSGEPVASPPSLKAPSRH
jgi:hypothetical protein